MGESEEKVSMISADIMMDDSDAVAAEPLTPILPKIAEPIRRSGVTEATNMALVMMKRKKKVSIQVPVIEVDGYRRLNRVYISSKKYKHLLDEIIGGVYGPPSRPELELQKFEFVCTLPSEETGGSTVSKTLQLNLVYDYEKNLYVISRRLEDKLLLYLHQNSFRCALEVGPLLSSTSCGGLSAPVSHLDPYRQRMWRRLFSLYVSPLLQDPLRLNYAIGFLRTVILSGEEEVLTPEGSEDGGWEFSSSDESSDDGTQKKKGKGTKGKRSNKQSGKTTGNMGTSSGKTKTKVVKKSKSLKKSTSKGK